MADSLSKRENKSLNDFSSGILSKEPTSRLECFSGLEEFLSNENNSIECDDLTGLVHGIFKWIEGSNFRIASNGLRILELFLDRMESDEFERFLDIVVSLSVDRLADSKDQVREAASNLIIKLMTNFTPQRLWDLIQPLTFDHKQYRIKEETQRLLVRSLNEFGASTIQLNKLVPLICKLVSDSNGTVRQQAVDTLVEIYRHVGEKVRGDIAKRDIPEPKLKQLFEKFDEVVTSGRMIVRPSEINESNLINTRPKTSNEKVRRDSESNSSVRSRGSIGSSTRTTTNSISSGTLAASHRSRSSSAIPRPTVSSGAAASGAVDEAIFEEAFNGTASINLSSGKEVENQLISIRETLADTNNDWEKRVDALKRIRSILLGDGDRYDEFFRNLRQLDLPLVATIRDLRSQIVREACITLAFMSLRLTNRFEKTAETVIPALLNLIQNSAKVMSTSAVVCLHFIVNNTHSQKLIPLILAAIESKSKEIRRHTYELLVVILSLWNLNCLEKHGQIIHDSIRKGLTDADPEARSHARKSFAFFREQFPSLADALLSTLDAGKKKMLLGDMSNASSTHSLASVGSTRLKTVKDVPKQTRLSSLDKTGSSTSLARSSSANELALRKKSTSSTTNKVGLTPPIQPANARTRLNSTTSGIVTTSKSDVVATRPPQSVSQSQPGSRSTSPHSVRSTHHLSSTMRTPTSVRSRIPIGSNGGSRISSRESSPGRTRAHGHRSSASDYGDHPAGRRPNGSWYGDSGDDASETSSICSERALEDLTEVLRRLASSEWAERKESLTSLYHMIRAGRTFNTAELKRLTELLTKRFYDPHSQVFSTFLDILPEFISAYKRELNEWLYTLLTRLLIRMGAQDLLESLCKKLRTCLSVVNSSFDVNAQFTVLIRFINDNSSAPSVKAKEILLRYLQQIVQHLEPVDLTNNTDIRISLSKIMNWASDPKSFDVRKASQAVVVAMHNLNKPEFNLMLTSLPQNIQDSAAKMIRSSNEMQSSGHFQTDNKFDFFQRTSFSGLTSPMSSSIHADHHNQSYASDMRILMENVQRLNVNDRHDEIESNNNSASKDNRSSSSRQYTPQLYRSNQPETGKNDATESLIEGQDRPAAISLAVTLANDHALPKDQRQQALRCILKFSKLKDPETWEIVFSQTLSMITLILDDQTDEVTLKIYALRILSELLSHYTNLFMNYIELTIFRILKAQSEAENEITRYAEQAAHAAAEYLPADHNVRVLKPIIEQAKYPMNQSAISMLQKTIDFMSKETCTDLLAEMVTPLLTSWDSETSSVRKAAVFCLVSIYMLVGENLHVHLNKLSSSKLKLLNVYISKAQQQANSVANSGTKS